MTSYFKAFGRIHTYDVTRNAFIWFGLLAGVVVSILSGVLELIVAGVGGNSLIAAIRGHPIDLVFFAHSGLLGLVFGAMGTMKSDLARKNEIVIKELTEQAMTDPLTGLHNRRYILDELKTMLLRARRSKSAVSVVFFDLDDFKGVNDRQGHRAGDVALQRVSEALQAVLRGGEALGRYGGDEFLLVVSGGLSHARSLVERAVESVRVRTHFSLSAGVARYPQDGTTPEELIAAADARLADMKGERREEHALVSR